jgi:hypothetical protein
MFSHRDNPVYQGNPVYQDNPVYQKDSDDKNVVKAKLEIAKRTVDVLTGCLKLRV